jgi:hypothetical protein
MIIYDIICNISDISLIMIYVYVYIYIHGLVTEKNTKTEISLRIPDSTSGLLYICRLSLQVTMSPAEI